MDRIYDIIKSKIVKGICYIFSIITVLNVLYNIYLFNVKPDDVYK